MTIPEPEPGKRQVAPSRHVMRVTDRCGPIPRRLQPGDSVLDLDHEAKDVRSDNEHMYFPWARKRAD